MAQRESKAKTKRTRTKHDDYKSTIQILPKTNRQGEHLSALETKDQVIVVGSAGTGKTFLSASYAAREFQLKNLNKIIITRPHVEVGKGLGYLKGDISEKTLPWAAPVLDVLELHLGSAVVETALKKGNIEVAPLALMRGRSFDKAMVLFDEAQNATFAEIKMLTTRIGEGSKLCITGDIQQSDLKETDGLTTIVDLVKKYHMDVPLIEYTIEDVVRSGIVKRWLEIYEKEKL